MLTPSDGFRQLDLGPVPPFELRVAAPEAGFGAAGVEAGGAGGAGREYVVAPGVGAVVASIRRGSAVPALADHVGVIRPAGAARSSVQRNHETVVEYEEFAPPVVCVGLGPVVNDPPFQLVDPLEPSTLQHCGEQFTSDQANIFTITML